MPQRKHARLGTLNPVRSFSPSLRRPIDLRQAACLAGVVVFLCMGLPAALPGVADGMKVIWPLRPRAVAVEGDGRARARVGTGSGASIIACSIDGMGVGWKGPDTRTPLFRVIQRQEPEEVKRLLAANVVVDLHSAAALGFVDSVRRLLDLDPGALNRPVNGMTPLAAAAGAGQTVVMADLIAAGANLEAGAPFLTALATAVTYGQSEALTLLLDAGAKLPQTPEDAEILLVLSIWSNSTRVFTQICDAGTLKVVGRRREKAFSAGSSYEVIERLSSDFRDPTVLGNELYHAALNGNMDVAHLVMDRGADIEATPRSGRATPMHMAARSGNTAILNLLVARGADVNREDKEGYTPLDTAFFAEQFVSARALRELGATHGPAWHKLSEDSRRRLTPPGWPVAAAPVRAK